MNKNKKLISLVAAIAMIFTMLSSFTFASAEGEAITLSTPVLSEDGTTVTVDINYAGITGGVADGDIKIAMPAEVTAVTANPTATVAVLKDGVFTYKFALGGAATDATEGTLTTLTLTLSEGLAAATDITIADGSYIDSNEVVPTYYEVGDNLTTNVVSIPADPNAPTPKPTTDATRGEEETEPGDDKPVLDDPVTAEKGLNFGVPSVSEDGLEITVPVDYVGITGGIADGDIKITMPAEVTAVTANPTATVAVLKDGVFTYKFALGGAATDATEGTLTTLTLTLSSPLSADTQLTFNTGSYIDSNEVVPTYYEVGADIVASNVIIPAFGAGEDVEKDVAGEISMNKVISVTVEDVVGEDGVSKYFIVPEVKKGGEAAVYGSDYVAQYNGTDLTEAQYKNLINGLFKAENVADLGVTSINDVINGLKYVCYDKGVTVGAALVNSVTSEIENADDETQTLTPAQSPKPTKGPEISVNPKTKTVNTGVKVTVSATVKNPVDGGVLTASYDAAALDLVTGSGIVINEETQAVTFTGAAKGKVVITYTYTDAEGNELAKAATSTITIKEKTVNDNDGGSSSSSSTGNDGPIANGNYGTTTTPGVLPGTTFTDLGSVTWAQEAINKLAAMGAISGRGNGIFDPNANITRAEYCQILVNAIGKSQEAADSNFDDVDTNAWYYHSVSVASAYGIVSGYGDGNFGPNNLITRRDMALMTMKAAQVEGVNLSAIRTLTFADADQFEYAAEAVNTLANAGIINGMSETEFAPLAYATRAQAAKIIYDTFVK